MSQSNIIAAYLFVAFVVFITQRQELRTYLGFFLGGAAPAPAPAAAPANVQTGSNDSGVSASSLASLAIEAAPYVLV